jgi:hypothetical protein
VVPAGAGHCRFLLVDLHETANINDTWPLTPMTEPPTVPIACSLTPDALRARRAGLLSDVLRRAECREELPEGLRLRFVPTSDTLAAVTRAVEAERHCCRFLRFAIIVEPDGGPVFLELTGPPGTLEFISALLDV